MVMYQYYLINITSKISLTNEQKLEYLSKLIQDVEHNLESNGIGKKIVKKWYQLLSELIKLSWIQKVIWTLLLEHKKQGFYVTNYEDNQLLLKRDSDVLS